MANLLCVTHDYAESDALIQNAVLAAERGVNVLAFARGVSIPLWEKAAATNAVTRRNIVLADANTIPEYVVDSCYLDAILVAVSVDCDLEREFALIAQARSIPLGVQGVFWGSERRFVGFADPKVLITCDDYGVELGLATFPRAHVFAAGHYGFSTEPVIVSEAIANRVGDLRRRFGKVFIFVGYTGTQVALMCASLVQTRGEWCMVLSPHPRRFRLTAQSPDLPQGAGHMDFIRSVFAPFGERIMEIEAPSSDPIIACSDVVFGGISNTLTTAAISGRLPVFLQTADTTQYLRDAYGPPPHGLSTAPAVTLGCAWKLAYPGDLSYLPCDGGLLRGKALEVFRPYDPEQAYKGIEALLG